MVVVTGGALAFFNGDPLFRSIPRSSPTRLLLSHRPMVVAMSNTNANHSYLTALNADIESHLKQAIPIRPPLSVFEPMHHLTFAAPMTNAPALCIAACELVGGQRDQAMAVASALHLMHAAAFTHRHLLFADKPRPSTRPTSAHSFGPNIKLMTGDGIVPFGFELLAASDNPSQNNSERTLRVIVEISRAAGAQGMIEGRHNELEKVKSNGEGSLHEGWIEHVCKKKEGLLHACAGACGAILGGGDEDEIEKLRRYGLYLGTIQGIYSVGRKEKWVDEEVNELRKLALNELEDFNNQDEVEAISSLLVDVETKLCDVQ